MSELDSRPIERSAEHFCTTNNKLAVTSMEWTILNFDHLKFNSELCLKSSSFESVQDGTSTGTWYMKLITKPMYANDGKIALFLVHPRYWQRALFVGLNVWIVDADGKATNKKTICYELHSSEIGFHNFIKKSSLLDSHLPNGNLTIHCYVAVVPLDYTEVKAGKPYSENSSTQGYSNLLKEGIFSDVVLVCGDKRFRAHKCVLSARSSVFREMFQQKVEDDVNIEDMDADILESLLSYIYSDSIQGKFTVNMAVKLLKGAEKYCLFELEDICEEFLESNVAVHNFFEVALTADLHNLNSLKEVCINYMYAHGKEIVFSWNFKKFLNTVPNYLLNGVLARILEGRESLKGKRLPASRPSRISQSKQVATSWSTGLRDAMEQTVVKGKISSQKQTTFLFGFSAENHPVFPTTKKVAIDNLAVIKKNVSFKE